MTCPACQLDRDACHACAGICPTCEGSGELADNPGWPDPQCVVTYECPTCGGEGMTNPDFNTRGESYQDMVLRLTRDDNAAAGFDEAFDELLARQERMDEYAGRQVPRQAGATVSKGASVSEAGSPPGLDRAIPLAQFPPRTMTGGHPSRPPVREDDERKAA
jgi:hypothetical protein